MSLAAPWDPSVPVEYYSAVSPQSSPLIGAEGGPPPSMTPTGVLRKQGESCAVTS